MAEDVVKRAKIHDRKAKFFNQLEAQSSSWLEKREAICIVNRHFSNCLDRIPGNL